MGKIASLLLLTKPGQERAALLAAEMRAWLAERGVRAEVLPHPAGRADCCGIVCSAVAGMDAVVVLGGDGTFIGVARQLVGRRVPFLGINFGRLGFLTETPASAWREALTLLLEGKLYTAPRTVLGWSLARDGERICHGHAINDVVLSRGSLARVANIHVSVKRGGGECQGVTTGVCGDEGDPLGWIRADGLIVASPLGSSAYSLSARGPLVHPDVSNLLLTAVAPFFGSMPPLVLPGDACVRLRCDMASTHEAEVCLTVDGQEGYPLQHGDLLEVYGVEGGLHLLLRHPDNYLATLRRRGFIRDLTIDGQPGASGGDERSACEAE